jgi:hypothetical protein
VCTPIGKSKEIFVYFLIGCLYPNQQRKKNHYFIFEIVFLTCLGVELLYILYKWYIVCELVSSRKELG